jgi:hypothetical protein
MFVATGVGTSILPVRFRVPPAVAIVTLDGDTDRQASSAGRQPHP